MLSYQHAYHAGSLADVHKHAVLAWVLAYMAQKDKPISYLETHAGRGLYDLSGPEATKTGEAAAGVAKLLDQFAEDHPYRQIVDQVRSEHGANAYPGSPLLAETFLHGLKQRREDRLLLAELHPQEHEALSELMPRSNVHVYKEDGFPWAARICPPTPRRGLMLIDPSYELDHDFTGLPDFIEGLHGLWPVGVIMLWYPILQSGEQAAMADALNESSFPKAIRHEVRFPAAQSGHRLTGSGLFVINAPYTLGDELAKLGKLFKKL